jgi:hypothetical protein
MVQMYVVFLQDFRENLTYYEEFIRELEQGGMRYEKKDLLLFFYQF